MPPDAVTVHEYGSRAETVWSQPPPWLSDSAPPPAGSEEAGSVDGADDGGAYDEGAYDGGADPAAGADGADRVEVAEAADPGGAEEPAGFAGAVAVREGVPRRACDPGVIVGAIDTTAGDATATGVPAAAGADGAADDDVTSAAGRVEPFRVTVLLFADGAAEQAVAPRTIATSAAPPAMAATTRLRLPPAPSPASGLPGTVRVLMGLLDRMGGQAEAKNIDPLNPRTYFRHIHELGTGARPRSTSALVAVIPSTGPVLALRHARFRTPRLVASRIGTAATLRAHDQRPSADRGRPFALPEPLTGLVPSPHRELRQGDTRDKRTH